jgi:hypothetical protein
MSEPKPWEQGQIDRAMDRARTCADPVKVMEDFGAPPKSKKRINIRQKGANGERQLATALNEIVNELLVKHGLPVPDKPIIQRNQNQTAVGGNDLSNTFGLGIEVKRQENLNVEAWWRQCEEAAKRNTEFPVLIYRQNNQAWRVVTYMWVQLPPRLGHDSACQVRGEMKWEAFLSWFRIWVDRKLKNGELPQV